MPNPKNSAAPQMVLSNMAQLLGTHVARTPASGLPPRRAGPPSAGASGRRGPLVPVLSGVRVVCW